jgi:hypothetical protein
MFGQLGFYPQQLKIMQLKIFSSYDKYDNNKIQKLHVGEK